MSAGTIVISGGILAGVILLCIVAVLCYCRLQVSVCVHDRRIFFLSKAFCMLKLQIDDQSETITSPSDL